MDSQVVKENGSYQTQRIQFVRQITSRTDNTALKDEDFLNCVVESIHNMPMLDRRQFIMKRAGTTQFLPSVASSQVRGLYYWADQQLLYYAVGTSLYVYNFSTSTTTTLTSVYSTSSGYVDFCEFLYDNGTVIIVTTDGTTLSTITSTGTVTHVTDPNLPVPHLPNIIFLDGYIFVVQANTANIYNSNQNDPTTWSSTDFIMAEMRPNHVNRIANLNNYLVVFGTESIEYFWDAGLTNGSPLQRNDTPIKINRYLGGFAQHGNNIYYVGEMIGGQPGVFRLSDFKIEEMSTPTITRYLNTLTGDPTLWTGIITSIQGHAVYILNAGTTTYACSVEDKFWSRWAYQATTNFPVILATQVTNSTIRKTVFALSGSSSALYVMDDTIFQDNGTNFTFQIVTEALDFGTLDRKYMARFALIGDRPPNNSNYTLYWSDDDYQTYQGGRSINMNQPIPSTYKLGTFRQRNFMIQYADNYPFRIQSYEVDINKGER